MTLRHLDLFSGIGGFALAARMVGGYETVAFCEIEPYCRAVLRKHWPGVPIYDDIAHVTGFELAGRECLPVDVITAGFPCQDISNAGGRAGIDGERSGLWSCVPTIIRAVRPQCVLVENVSALLGRGLAEVLGDLAEIGYDAEWHCVPASAVGAEHERDRIWIVAYPVRPRFQVRREAEQDRAHAGILGPRIRPAVRAAVAGLECRGASRWSRDVHGIPRRVDRITALGNAIVPQVAAIFLEAIKECGGVGNAP